MGRLIYSAITSLDGYVADEDGDFSWAEPDEEVHAFINDLMRPIGTHLYGRRMYEVMTVWETDPTLASASPVMRDFAELWKAADKVVFSRTLARTSTARTRIERELDPDAVRQLKDEARSDLIIGGPELAGEAIREGLVDECRLLIAPIAVGGGKPALPAHARWELKLMEERAFVSGMVHLRYGDRTSRPVAVTE